MEEADRKLLREVADRCRRTETRVTMVANHIGVEAGGSKPVFDAQNHRMVVASRKTSIDDVLDAIPRDHRGDVYVCVGDDYLMTVNV
jgi:hypothetical protein